MPNVLVRDVPRETLEGLKQQAAEHRRSLQQELLSVLNDALARSMRRDPAEVAATIRRRLAATGRTFGDSAALVREDRLR